jgi:hypothetical protein
VDVPLGGKPTVTFDVTKRDLAYWSPQNKAYTVDAGKYEIQIGSSSVDIRLLDTLTVANNMILSFVDSNSNTVGALPAQNKPVLRNIAMQRVLINSGSNHYAVDAKYYYDIFSCDGKKLMRCKAADVNTYFSHAIRGIYLITGHKL